MKTLSICQPWVTLVILGIKRLETRSWRTSRRGRIAIHASRAFTQEAQRLCGEEPFRSALEAAGFRGADDLPLGALLGTVELVGCTAADDLNLDALDAAELAFGDFGPGRWAWELRHPQPLDAPVPFRGRLGFFEAPDELFRPRACATAAAHRP
jgi:hypothetical protein